jgi:light-regulated signal transduction histidine kinase (bacteriophytochrome)
MSTPSRQNRGDAQSTIDLLQHELAATNHEVMLLTLELEQRVAERTAQLIRINQELTREVGERRQADHEIQKLNHDLEERALLLQAANEELEAFSYSVSHDLRAPLRHISGFAQVLREGAVHTLTPDGLQIVDRIAEAARKMATLIDDLLRFSRLSHSALNWSQLDLNELLKSVINDFEPDLKGRNVEFKCGMLPGAWGDADLLRQVLINLVSNALKYSRPSNPAIIETGAAEGDSPELVFFVRDNGVGFDPHRAHNLFGVFKRLHSDQQYEGTGIGLANVRRIVSRHGGRVWAESKPGDGATFYFSLPRHKPNGIA